MSSSLVWHFAGEKATFARGQVFGHTGLPLYESSFYQINHSWVIELYTHTVSSEEDSLLLDITEKTMQTYANKGIGQHFLNTVSIYLRAKNLQTKTLPL